MAILKDLIVQGSSRHIGTSYFGYMYGFLTGYVDGDISGNAATADKWKTPRSIKIGDTSHDLDGSANVTWTLSEIGAQASGNYVTKEELSAKAYLQKAGGTMTGTLTLLANQYEDSNASGALNANNSDLYNVNSIKFADSSGGPSEGLQWKRSSGTNVDSIWVLNGEAYITPNRTFGSTGTNYKFLHEGNLLNHQFTNSAYGVLLSYAPPTKTSSQLGLKKETTTGKYYGVVATNNGYAYVNVPWSDTDIHVTSIQYSDDQDGILTTISQNDHHFDSNDIIPIMSSTTFGVAKTAFKDPDLTLEDINSESNNHSRWYGVQKLPKTGNLVVNVPWSDTLPNQTNHYTPSNFASEYNEFGNYVSTAASYAIIGISYSFDPKRHIGVISYAYAPVSSVNNYVTEASFSDSTDGTGKTLTLTREGLSNLTASLPKATGSSYGVIKVSRTSTITKSTITGTTAESSTTKRYLVSMTKDGFAYVGVPWSDTNTYIRTTYFTTHSNIAGLQVNITYGTTATPTAYVAYNSSRPVIPVASDSSYGVIKAKAVSSTTVTGNILAFNTSNRYGVVISGDGIAYVAVPWTDHYATSFQYSDTTDGILTSIGTNNQNFDLSDTIPPMTVKNWGVAKTMYDDPEHLTAEDINSASDDGRRWYGVQKLAKSGNLIVNVPWSDTLPNQANHYTPSNFANDYNQFGEYSNSNTRASYAIIGMSYSFDSKRHIGVISYAYANISSDNTYIRSAYFKDESSSYTLYIAYANNATSNIGYVKTSIVKQDAANKFIGSLPVWTAVPTDNAYLIRQDTGGSLSFGRVKFSTLKPWIHAYVGTLSYVTKADLSAQGYVNAPMTTATYGYAKLGDSNILTIGNKIYGVGITADGQLAVNVPWVGGGTGADGNDFVDGAEFTDDTNGNGKLLTLSVGTQNDVTANINVMSDSSYGVAKSYYGRLTEEILVNDATTITGKWVGTNITEDGKIVTNIGNVAGGNGKIFYGTCASTATSTTKEVNCAEFTTDDLKDGTVIYVKFDATNSGSVSSLKLKVGNTSAYPIKKIMNGAWGNLSSTADLRAGSIMQFTYTKASSSNTYWQILSTDYNANTYVRRTYFTNQNTGLQVNITYGTSTSTSTYIRDLNGNRPVIPIASDSSYGVIKAKAVSATTVTENIYASNTSNRYGVVISGDGIAYVAVPWTDSNCTSSGHYSPSFDEQSASGTHDNNLESNMHIVTGLTYTKDSKGHIGSISYSYAGLSLSYFVTSNTNPVNSSTLVRVKTIITSQTVGDEPAALYIIV